MDVEITEAGSLGLAMHALGSRTPHRAVAAMRLPDGDVTRLLVTASAVEVGVPAICEVAADTAIAQADSLSPSNLRPHLQREAERRGHAEPQDLGLELVSTRPARRYHGAP